MTDPALRRGTLLVVTLAAAAFLVYRATLLPGFDFGDTASFQAAGGSPEVTPRQGYPLYFALGNLVIWTSGADPAWGMNLLSAICGALAVGATAALVILLTGSLVGGAVSGVLLGSAYTFWTHAIIAEVYTLHVLLVTGVLLATIWWGRNPESMRRLAAVFGIYALGFGNHLMMILLAPALAAYLALRIPGGPLALLRPRVAGLALACASLGALQYAWNFSWYWSGPEPPPDLGILLQAFWFDVTKSDWRETMVMAVHESALRHRRGMYLFLLDQQFGAPAVALALTGLGVLAWRGWREGVLLVLVFAVALAFAWTYNVGDAEVFFLPSHHVVAVLAGCGSAAVLAVATRLAGRRGAALAAVLLLFYPAWRVADTWPAVDRSADVRPRRVLDAVAGDLAPEQSLLLADLNWQLQNGLDYYGQHLRPELVHLRAGDSLQLLPFILEANLAAGREVVLTPRSRQLLTAAFGRHYAIEPDPRIGPLDLADRLAELPPGATYVLALLQAYSDVPLERAELDRAARELTGGAATLPTGSVYTIMAGRVGEPPGVVRESARPFRLRTAVGGQALLVRMDSWLPADTMRRAGFGHVIANGRHVLTLERGVSVVVLGRNGAVVQTEYASSLYAPQPRYRIRASGVEGTPGRAGGPSGPRGSVRAGRTGARVTRQG